MQDGLLLRSESDLKEQKFQLVPDDEYVAVIEDYELKPNEPDNFNPGQTRDIVVFKMKPRAFADGSDLEDIDGNPLEDNKRFMAWIEPARTGFGPAGPSRARKFFAAALGVPPTGEIRIDSYKELVGKELIVGITTKNGKNSPTDYRAVKINRRRKAETPAPETTDLPDVQAEAEDGDDPF